MAAAAEMMRVKHDLLKWDGDGATLLRLPLKDKVIEKWLYGNAKQFLRC